MIWRNKPVGLGLIGCGNMGAVHAGIVQANKRARLLWVFDADYERARGLAGKCPGTRAPERIEQLLEDRNVEGVIIATPHNLHYEQGIQALSAGKHVLMEKPMALDANESERMMMKARETGRKLLVGQVMRFWPNVKKAREAIQRGDLGQIHHVLRTRLVYQRDAARAWAHDPAQSGGWLIHGISVHEVDALLYMIDQEITEIRAVTARNNPIWNDVDEISALLRFKNGAIGACSHSLNSHYSSLDTTIIGSKGSIRLSDFHLGYMENGHQVVLGDNQGLGDQLVEFLRAIRDGERSRIEADDILPTMRLLDVLRAAALP